MVATADDVVFAFSRKDDSFAENHFEINSRVNADGPANGIAHFFFGEEFSAAWGPDGMTLEVQHRHRAVNADGTMVFRGLSYEETSLMVSSVKEMTPFGIVVDPAQDGSPAVVRDTRFGDLEITKGHLKVR